MPHERKYKYFALNSYASASNTERYDSHSITKNTSGVRCLSNLLPCLLTVSLLANFAVVLQYSARFSLPTATSYVSRFADLAYDTTRVFQYHNEYWGPNETLSDQLWDQIDTSPVMVTFSESYIREKGLPPSIPFPWDQSRSLYYIKAFHTLHCLKLLYKAFTGYQRDGISIVDPKHIMHCLDSIRQDTLCNPDDTPMPAPDTGNLIGDNQVLQCRSIEKLSKWVYTTERNPCFQMVNEYGHIKHALEKYAFCPPDSPYRKTMVEYFKLHGHQDMFSEEANQYR